MNKNIASTIQVNASVAHTGRELQTGQLFEPAQAANILPAYQQTFQPAQRAPSPPTLHPNQVQKPAGDLLQTTAAPDNFQRFVDTVKDGEAGVLRGVYVDGVLALAVMQQPKNDVLYVSSVRGIATQFQNAAKFGITGLNVRNRCTHPLGFDKHPPTFPVLQVSKSRLKA